MEELQSIDKVYYLPRLSKSEREQSAKHDGKSKHRFPKLEPEDQILFKYRIIDRIATGAAGRVIKALDMSTHDQRPVAIKFVPRHHDISNERKVLKLLRPRNETTASSVPIVRLMETINYRGWSALVFPFYDKDWFARNIDLYDNNRYFGLSEMKYLTMRMLKALLRLKSRHIIHRDIKPENIMYDSETQKSYLTDFGAALIVDEDHKMTSVAPGGTMSFMPPEFLMNVGYPTYEADMWSLGATLFTLMTSKHIVPSRRSPDFTFLHCLPELIRRVPPESKSVNGVEVPIASVQNGSPAASPHRYKTYIEDLKALKNHFRKRGQKKRYDSLIDFISHCLIWDPAQRMTAEEAAKHPFIMLDY